jgi:hypothetical protein
MVTATLWNAVRARLWKASDHNDEGIRLVVAARCAIVQYWGYPAQNWRARSTPTPSPSRRFATHALTDVNTMSISRTSRVRTKHRYLTHPCPCSGLAWLLLLPLSPPSSSSSSLSLTSNPTMRLNTLFSSLSPATFSCHGLSASLCAFNASLTVSATQPSLCCHS